MASRLTQSRVIRPFGTAFFRNNRSVSTGNHAVCYYFYSGASTMMSTRGFHSSNSVYGIGERLTGAFTRGAEEKQEQAVFDAQLKFLLDRSKPMNGDNYRDFLAAMQVASGMGGMKQHLPWVANNPGMQDFKDRDAILCAMTPAERSDLRLVKIGSKKRISKATGQSIESVEAMIDQIDVMASVGQWLQKLEDDGAPLPKTTSEMRTMLAAPGSGLKRKRKQYRGGMQNPGLGKMAKRR